MYDFANSGYTTVILTAIFNAYFVGVIAAGQGSGDATLLWTLAMAATNALVLVSAPVVGAIADYSGAKKRFLTVTTIGCVMFTALLYFAGPGDIALAIVLVILATFMFASGENLIAAFLPEISTPQTIGRLSGYGWALGYLGGLLALVLCLGYVTYAEKQGIEAAQYVPVTNLIVAALFALAALPTLSSETRAVMLTGNLQRDVSVRARNLGAVAALPKGMGLHELLDALRRVLAGERLFTYDEAAPAPLTAREAEVLQLLANGDDPRQAARRLGLSAHTVRDYVRSAREKLGVRTQLAAVVAAAGLGIVELPAPCEA